MKILKRIYLSSSKLLPKRYLNEIENLLRYCDIKVNVNEWCGFLTLFSLALGIIAGIYSNILFNVPIYYFPLIIILGAISMHALVYIILVLIADRRAKFAEQIFPDMLSLMSSNIKAGMLPYQAMISSARPEFGPLEEEIKKIAKLLFTGKSFQEALKELPKKFRSNIIKKTIDLIIEGINAGGELASLLDQTSNDIRNMEVIRKEIKANVIAYVIFIFLAAGFAAPLLHGVSLYLIETISKFSKIDIPEALLQRVPFFRIGTTDISPQFVLLFSVGVMTITSVFSSLIIGLIEKGEEKAGVKYIPILLSLSLGVFFITHALIVSMFGYFI